VKTALAETQSETALTRAFERFAETSERLEARYYELLRETEGLRAALKAKDAEMKRRERLAALGETAAALAHEVRNPLGAMQLFLSLLRQDVADRPQAAALVNEIGKSLTNLNGVVSNILHFAKHRAVNRVPMNIAAVIQEVCSQIQAQMSPPGKVTVALAGTPFILGDEHGLRQVFYNLLTNAAQAVNYTGTLSVSTRTEAGMLVVLVQDNGQGIKESILPTLFEPFVSGRESGTGLGLSIVRQVVELHGGTIKAWNNQGACFEIQLPIS
jgi:two-component system sensor histidine kinase FlrB